jgi:hypothetical protein
VLTTWPLVLLVTVAALVFRWQGDSWPMTVAKLVGLIVLALVVVAVLGIVIARLS